MKFRKVILVLGACSALGAICTPLWCWVSSEIASQIGGVGAPRSRFVDSKTGWQIESFRNRQEVSIAFSADPLSVSPPIQAVENSQSLVRGLGAIPSTPPSSIDVQSRKQVFVRTFGWPVAGVQSWVVREGGVFTDRSSGIPRRWVHAAPSGVVPFPLGLTPVWPQFCWVAIPLSLNFFGMYLVGCLLIRRRKRSRVKRGVCPECQYPLSQQGICVECGWPSPSGPPSGGGTGSYPPLENG